MHGAPPSSKPNGLPRILLGVLLVGGLVAAVLVAVTVMRDDGISPPPELQDPPAPVEALDTAGREAPQEGSPEPPAPEAGGEEGMAAPVTGRDHGSAHEEATGRAARDAEAAGDPAAGPEEAGRASQDVARLLAAAEAAYSGLATLRARFDQTIEVPLLERRREGHGTWYQRGRSHFLMEFDEPEGDVIVADGTYLWLYYPSTNPRQVIRSTLGEGDAGAGTADVLAAILREARTAYEAEHAGRDEVKGVTCEVVDLRPLERSPYRRVTVWIGAEDHLVRRFRIVEENETVRTVSLWELRPGSEMSDSLFRFTPPDGVEVFAR